MYKLVCKSQHHVANLGMHARIEAGRVSMFVHRCCGLQTNESVPEVLEREVPARMQHRKTAQMDLSVQKSPSCKPQTFYPSDSAPRAMPPSPPRTTVTFGLVVSVSTMVQVWACILLSGPAAKDEYLQGLRALQPIELHSRLEDPPLSPDGLRALGSTAPPPHLPPPPPPPPPLPSLSFATKNHCVNV